MRATYKTAAVIAVLIAVWLISGQIGRDGDVRHPSLADINRENAAAMEDKEPTRVRVAVLTASEQNRTLTVRGKTENKRTVTVRAETTGRVIARPVDRGSVVRQGDLLCELSIEDRQAGVIEATEQLNQARIDYQGALKLKKRGFQSETAIATAKAKLASAEAQLTRRKLDLARTRVRAPFDAVVEDVHQEVGSFVGAGNECATLVDLNPMLLVGRVSEREVVQLELGQMASAMLADGREVAGPITFIGRQSDAATRTYRIEAEVPNPAGALRSGITAQVEIPVETTLAQRVSPGLFALDDAGNIGIRTIDADNRVRFHLVDIVGEDADGVWVTGLPDLATVITVGQELVVAGEEVEPEYEQARELPASAPDSRPVSPVEECLTEPCPDTPASTGTALAGSPALG